MSARDTYVSTVKSAVAARVATTATNQAAQQETINASGVNVGYTLQNGNYANLAAAVKNAIRADVANRLAAAQAEQASVAVARDTLRADATDRAPV